MSVKSCNKDYKDQLIMETFFLPTTEKPKQPGEQGRQLEIFKINEARKRFDSFDNYSIIITNDFKQWMEDYNQDQNSLIDPIDLELLTKRRKCSIIDQGENLIIFPGYDGADKNMRKGNSNLNEINIEFN